MMILANVLALLCAFVAMVQLSRTASKIGGKVGKIFKLIIAGILFSVFIHAGVELMAQYGLLSEKHLMAIMGLLISLGSLFFISAGIYAQKKFKI